MRPCCKGSVPHPMLGSRLTARSHQISVTIAMEPALVRRDSSVVDKLDVPGRVMQSLAAALCKFPHQDHRSANAPHSNNIFMGKIIIIAN